MTMALYEPWYNPKGIANILALSQVEKKHCVTYDSAASKAFVVHKNDGSDRGFEQAKSGLFYLDTEQSSGTVTPANCDYQRALLARSVQNTICHTSTRDFIHIVKEKAFVVHKNDGSDRGFGQAKSGLFYLNTEQSSGTVTPANCDYHRALLARSAQNTISHTLTEKQNLYKSCIAIY
jgi:hypothetical protein